MALYCVFLTSSLLVDVVLTFIQIHSQLALSEGVVRADVISKTGYVLYFCYNPIINSRVFDY